MLAIQAHRLDAIFNGLARRSQSNMGQYLDQYLDAADIFGNAPSAPHTQAGSESTSMAATRLTELAFGYPTWQC